MALKLQTIRNLFNLNPLRWWLTKERSTNKSFRSFVKLRSLHRFQNGVAIEMGPSRAANRPGHAWNRCPIFSLKGHNNSALVGSIRPDNVATMHCAALGIDLPYSGCIYPVVSSKTRRDSRKPAQSDPFVQISSGNDVKFSGVPR